MKTVLKTLLSVALLGIVAVFGFVYSGVYDVSATAPHSGVVHWGLQTIARVSVARRAKAIKVPDLNHEALVLAGANDYREMCAGCHGAPGQSPRAVGRGLNPRAPDLSRSATRMTAAQLFWVTKHGVKMTGMPAWGATHDDASLWPVVAFVRKLPELGPAAYRAILERATNSGHHSGHAGEHAPVHDHEPCRAHRQNHRNSGDHGGPGSAGPPTEGSLG